MAKKYGWTVIAVLIGGNLIWGASYGVGKFLLVQIPPFTLTLIRFVIATAVMLPFAWRPRGQWRPLVSLFPNLALLGGIGLTAVYILQYGGMVYTTSSIASILSITEPVALVLLARLLFGERLHGWTGVGTAIAVAGVALLSVGDVRTFSLGRGEFLGNALLILSMLGACGYTLMSKPLAGKLPPIQITAWAQVWATLLALPFAVWEMRHLGLPHINPLGWAGLLFVGVGCMSVGYVAWNFCLARMPASAMAAAMYLHPVVGVLLGFFWLGEHLSPLAWIGGGLAVAGVTLTMRSGQGAGHSGKEAVRTL